MAAEKERNSLLDRKLYEEKKAAQVVSKDVQKYVEYAKGLEVKVEELKVKAKASKQEEIPEVKAIDDSILCQTCVIDDDNNDNHLQNIADKVEKIAVSIQHRNEEIVQEIKLSKIQVPTSSSISSSRDVPDESQSHHRSSSRKSGEKKAALKMELAEVEAERDSLLLINEQLQKEVNR